MADYAQLSALTGKLKRAAIDAYMKRDQWEVEGDHYEIPGNSTNKVSRPGEDGNGGGDWSGDFLQEWIVGGSKDREFGSEFDKIRSTIDTALKRWQPDAIATPSEFEPLIASMRDANTALALSASTSGGSVTGGGSIAGNIKGLDDETNKMSGDTINVFRSKFVLQLNRVVGGQHALSVVLGAALAAEQKLWEQAQPTIVETIEKATTSFDTYAKGQPTIDWGLILKVVGVAVEGAAAFASDGATIALTAGTGIKLLSAGQESVDKNAKNPKSPDPDAIMKAFTDALDKLDQAIAAEEGSLAANLRDNYDYVIGQKGKEGSFDLTLDLLGISDDSQAEIHIVQESVDAIVDTYMPAIARSLTAAAEAVDGASSSIPWIREDSVGYTAYGHWSDYYTLLYLLLELAKDLSWEVTNGAKTLDLVVQDIGRADTDAQDALEKHAAEVKEGSGYSPYPEPPTPEERRHGGYQAF